MKRCVLLYNKQSGKTKKKNYIDEFKKILANNGYQTETIESQYRGHITDIVSSLSNNVDLVLSVGGDGTFNESMRGNFNRKKKLVLAHIPMGTTNDVGKMFGYSKNPINNVKLLMAGEVKEIDICKINNNPFIYVAGFGKYMNISYETKRKNKKKFGYLAYVGNAVKNFFKKTDMYDITYQVDGKTYTGNYSFLAITNSTRMAGVKIFEDIKLNDDAFELMFCSIKKRKKVIKALIKFKRKGIDKVEGITLHKTNKLKIKFNSLNTLDWCLDGEKYTIDGNEVEVKIDQAKVMLPKTNIDKLFIKK